MRVQDVLFNSRFTAKLRSGTRPSVPEGPGDAHYVSATAILSLANDAGDTWIEYDLNNLTSNTPANGGTGQSTYAVGDLLVGNAGAGLSKLGVGTNGDVLTADSGQSLGLRWATPGTGAATSMLVIEFNNTQTIPDSTPTSLTYSAYFGSLASNFDLTSSPNITVTTGGDYLIQANVVIDGLSTFATDVDFWIRVNSSKVNATRVPYNYTVETASGLVRPHIPGFWLSLSNGDVIDIQVNQTSGFSFNVANTTIKGLSCISFMKVS